MRLLTILKILAMPIIFLFALAASWDDSTEEIP